MKNFLVSKNKADRVSFIKKIRGEKIAIYNRENYLLDLFDIKISMKDLMNDAVFLETLALSNANTTIVLIDILIKNNVYSTVYGKIYAFTETAKQVFIIDTFAFKWDEKQIFRPFFFINPKILGSSLGEFFNTGIYKDFKENTIDVYFEKILPYIEMKVPKIKINIIKYEPSQKEINEYNLLKEKLIMKDKLPKMSVISKLIEFIDNTASKKEAIQKQKDKKNIIKSNRQRNKFLIYDILSNENENEITFFSSGIYGADEIELNKTKNALIRHNYLIEKYERVQQK